MGDYFRDRKPKKLEDCRIMPAYRYDPAVVQPMREELTQLGFAEVWTPAQVDAAVSRPDGTTLIVVNSVCGCAAGSARPGVRLALQDGPRPDHLVTVFAGMELDAVEQVRVHFAGYPPSSPQIALFKNGQLVHIMERQNIEGRTAEQIAEELRAAFRKYCVPA